MSTAVIFSGCTESKRNHQEPQVRESEVLKIGVSTDLLSFDPFSFQSLGEQDTRALIYGRLFEVKKKGLTSDYLSSLVLKKNRLSFDAMSDGLYRKTKAVFKKGKASTLWKGVFLQFDLFKDHIFYKGSKDFIAQLQTLSTLILFEGDGLYKIISHKKGKSLELKPSAQMKSLAIKFNKTIFNKIKIQKVKADRVGLDLVQTGVLDLYFPQRPLVKGIERKYKEIDFVKSKETEVKLRLYHKYNKKNILVKTYCKNKEEIKKLLSKEWRLEKSSCGFDSQKRNKIIKVVYSDSIGAKILDFLFHQHKVLYGQEIKYSRIQSFELAQVLKQGMFDYHLSLENISPTTPVSYDSFHSKGKFNTYRIRDKKLDKILENLSTSHSLERFYQLQDKAKIRLGLVSPLVFSYSQESVSYIKKRDARILEAKKVDLGLNQKFIFLNK